MKKIVEITWVDSSGLGQAWSNDEDIKDIELAQCKSAGYLIKKDKDKTVLAMSVSVNSKNIIYNNEYGRIFVIPTKAIIKSRTFTD